MILGGLGVSLCGQPGYSVHARFKFLHHWVSNILPTDPDRLPMRQSLALYSQAKIYDSAARVSGAQKEPAVFSDSSMWLPFPPSNFSVDECKRLLRAQENHWRDQKKAKAKAI